MTKNEAAALVKMISTMYPNEYTKIDVAGMKMIVEMWARVTEGYTGEQMSVALQQYMATDTSGFAPKPGQLLQHVPEHKKLQHRTNNFIEMQNHNVVIDDAWWKELAAKPGNLI